MRAVILMFDSLNRNHLPPYAPDTAVRAPNFARLAEKTVTFDTFYAGSMPCMPARRELQTGRPNFLHRSWGPMEPFDCSMPQMLGAAGVHSHLASDHPHYWEDGGATYHTRYTTWEFFRGQEGDPWKGVVSRTDPMVQGPARMRRQDVVNRTYMPTSAEHSQTLTVDAGLHFLETNAAADRWLLQLELFDPHEPFFSHQEYREQYDLSTDDPRGDWPAYAKVTEDAETVEHFRREYSSLVSMCDDSLGRVLDAFDRHDLWQDTMLIVNTDHGFLLGEHGWWAKGVQPWYDELVHLPFFLWDPRTGEHGSRRSALVQTVDIAPTILSFFELDPPASMLGHDLSAVLADDAPVREGGLFGIHGGHVNVTDGRYVYMRASEDVENAPLEEFTLMPTHMRSLFSIDELEQWEPAEPFDFTRGLRTMRTNGSSRMINPWRHGTLLFDPQSDPQQLAPLVDDDVELRMCSLLVDLLRENDAPESQYTRLGLPRTGTPSFEHLHVKAHAARAEATKEPLVGLGELAEHELARLPVHELLLVPELRPVVDSVLPDISRTEWVALPPGATVLDLARRGTISRTALEALISRADEMEAARG